MTDPNERKCQCSGTRRDEGGRCGTCGLPVVVSTGASLDERIWNLRELDRKATPGNWELVDRRGGRTAFDIVAQGQTIICANLIGVTVEFRREADQELLVALRNEALAIIDELKRELKIQVETCDETLRDAQRDVDELTRERDELRGGDAFTHPLCSDCARAVVWHDPEHPSPVRMCPRCVHARRGVGGLGSGARHTWLRPLSASAGVPHN